MRMITAILTVASALVFSGFVYQQAFVEGEIGPAAMVGIAVLSTIVLGLAVLTYLSGTRYRTIVGNILLSATATFVAYFVLDFIAGWLLIVPLSPPLVPDEYRHHALVPDSYSELRQRDFSYVQRVNSLGLRGRETTAEKSTGTKRILMLGDSFTMGKGVEDGQTFSVLVEDLVNASLKDCGGGTVEVLNAGVDSYAPILSYIQFERDLLRLAPDLVILNLDNSDLIQEAAYRKQAIRDQNGAIIAVPQVWQDSLYERIHSWTSRHLYFTRVILVYVTRAMDHREITVRRVANEFGRAHFVHTLEGDVDRTAQWQDIFESIGRIKHLADSIRAEFLLATYPWAHQVNETDWVPGRYAFMDKGEHTTDITQQTVRRYTADLGIELFEALPVFEEYRGSEPLYFQYDPHWTAAGHRVMAKGLSKYINQQYISNWCKEK